MSLPATVGALDVPLGARCSDLSVLGVVDIFFFGLRGLRNVLFFGRSIALGPFSITLALVGAHGLFVSLPGEVDFREALLLDLPDQLAEVFL